MFVPPSSKPENGLNPVIAQAEIAYFVDINKSLRGPNATFYKVKVSHTTLSGNISIPYHALNLDASNDDGRETQNLKRHEGLSAGRGEGRAYQITGSRQPYAHMVGYNVVSDVLVRFLGVFSISLWKVYTKDGLEPFVDIENRRSNHET